ncbi:MAG: IS66 family transposase [Lachnospiraceae bacterium]|nr:IS66 family transposase [Lachnospiraceae bacterium]MCM1441894.1 IS66 family transposase [Roseburia sp.]
MINEMDIQRRILTSELLSAQNEIAFLKGKAAECVSREQYKAKCDENEMNVALLKEAEAEIARYKEEAEAAKFKNDQFEKRIKELEKENAEKDEIIARLEKKEFEPTSEILDDDDDDIDIPENRIQVLACVQGLKLAAKEMSKSQSRDENAKKPKRGKDRKKRRPRKPSDHNPGVYTDDIADTEGINLEGLGDVKILKRGEDLDKWIFRVLYVRRIRVYSKEFTIARCYDPSTKDFVNSNYPDGLYAKCHLSPSFIAFYFRLKVSYNVSEQNILRALEAAGCDIPQATLNEYIQEAERVIREFLQPAMVREIQESRFTHNDETRLTVKCPDKKTGVMGYHTEYVHGILSPSANILLMLYDNGSRKHDIQEEIMKGSMIECFTCDRAKMYPKIVRDLVNSLDREITRASCWVHWRRDVFDLAKYDGRFKPILKALKILFKLEKKWREGEIGEQERLDKRQELSRPIVDYIFDALKEMKSKPEEYGEQAMQVINYLLNDEESFRAFLKHGLIEIDNNAIERCFRHIAMGRRTWLFTGSHAAAENLTFMYSLEESCKMNGIDFGDYIEYVMERMVAGEKDARSLLPNHVQIPSDWVPEGQLETTSIEKTA